MRQRNLGHEGLATSAIGLGTMGMTMAYGAGDEPGGIATIRRAHELGVTMLDTAELYGGGAGTNETLVGQAVKGRRGQVIIATKFGLVSHKHGSPKVRVIDSSPASVKAAVEGSLKRLRIEVIDLLKQPQLAQGDQILAIPTLVRKLPEPIKKIIGDMSNEERVLVGLDVQPLR